MIFFFVSGAITFLFTYKGTKLATKFGKLLRMFFTLQFEIESYIKTRAKSVKEKF